ncbi:MAG: hypothetical protein QM778_08740 [Myxococcales bacterium]
MGKVLPDELVFPDLEDDEDTQLEGDEELVGTPDADDIVLADIGGGPEEIGLDAETGADERGEGALGAELLDADDLDDGESRWSLDEKSLEIEDELDLDDEDERWTEDSEGMGSALGDDLDLDDDESLTDDGGLEGVDDPMVDGLDLDGDEDGLLEKRAIDDEDEEESANELGDELSSDLLP